MATPIKGTSGAVKHGPTGSAVTVAWISEWSFESTSDKEEIGPHLGDANKYPIATSITGKFTAKGTIPQDGDAGQDAMFVSHTGQTSEQLVLYAVKGKQITFAAPVYESVKIEMKADGTQTFEVAGSGAYALADGPAS